MSSELVITARGLGKAYNIYRRPEDRLKQMFFRWRRYYEQYWALRDLSLEIRRGETVGIVGRNGSGKSTFLQIACGTLDPTCGTIESRGRIAALLELGAGFNPEFSGRENVYLSASILGLTREQIDERYAAIVAFAGIGDFLEQPTKTYSSGMQARLAFAVAAHVDADILIVDEVLAVGDAAFSQKCMRFIRRFKEEGTLLFVSHDVSTVIGLCDRAIWLDNGMLRETGTAKEVCHHYMAALESEGEDASTFQIGGTRKRPPTLAEPVQDVRADLLRQSGGMPRVEVSGFDPDAPWFGRRGATIAAVALLDANGADVAALEGGEEVVLRVECEVHHTLRRPIVGFYVKDRLGQTLFGDNTYLMYRDRTTPIFSGQTIVATFRFQLPYLAAGDYSVVAAIADGTQDDHVQHHWIDDAMFFRVVSSHIAHGLMGVPLLSLDLMVTGGRKASEA
jgi:lipopolysaccharide transport system ATP-binding protein